MVWIRKKKEHFYEKLDDIANAFYRQEEADQELTLKLEELNKNPEYVKRIKECTREQGVDAMLLVLKEFGVEITFMELKQYGFRKAGLMWANTSEVIGKVKNINICW